MVGNTQFGELMSPLKLRKLKSKLPSQSSKLLGAAFLKLLRSSKTACYLSKRNRILAWSRRTRPKFSTRFSLTSGTIQTRLKTSVRRFSLTLLYSSCRDLTNKKWPYSLIFFSITSKSEKS